MKFLVNSVLVYFLFPICVAFALLLVLFYVPDGFYPSLFALFVVVVSVVLLFRVFVPIKLALDQSFKVMTQERKYQFVVLVFCFAVFLSGPIDVYQNGFKLLDPASYAEFNGVGRYVRHISSLCWTLVPIAFIFVSNFKRRLFLIGYALVFPVIIVDRNRLLASFFGLVLCLALESFLPKKNAVAPSRKGRMVILPLVMLLTFAGLGFFRSGESAFVIESSGGELSEDALPLREIFYYLPTLVQQVVLYITTPVFNFATIVHFDFKNEEFLLSQLSPFGRDMFDTYPYAPVMVPRFNVGTEFYPFLLYGGLPLVLMSVVFMVCTFLLAGFLLKKYPNIFTFLIFLKIAHSVVFMGFAPQFYLLLNIGFVFLMLILWGGSSLLKGVRLRDGAGRKSI